MSLNFEYGKYGAKRTAFKSADPEAVLARIMERNPTATIEELREMFTKAIDGRASRNELRETIDLYYVTNNARRLRNPEQRERPERPSPEERAERKAQAETKASADVERIKTHILLNAVMRSTAEELAALIKDAAKCSVLIKKLKPGQRISDVYSEEQVLKILNGK